MNGEFIVRGKSRNRETSQGVARAHEKEDGGLHDTGSTGDRNKGERFRCVLEVELYPGFGLRN